MSFRFRLRNLWASHLAFASLSFCFLQCTTLVFSTIILLFCPSVVYSAVPPAAVLEDRIYGGIDVVAPVPWMAGIYKTGKLHCGATLISPNWILTAAHCLTDDDGNLLPTNILSVAVGILNQNTKVGAQTSLLGALVPAPGWDPTLLRHDIGLAYLQTPIKVASYATLNTLGTPAIEAPGSNSMIFGWGSTETSNEEVVPNLRAAALPVVDLSLCTKLFGTTFVTLENLCAGAPGKDACQGDSGGPLVVNYGNSIAQIGITSWGEGCGEVNKYGVYTRVAPYVPWITSMLNSTPTFARSTPSGNTNNTTTGVTS